MDFSFFFSYVTFKIIQWLLPLAREILDSVITLWALNNSFNEEADTRWSAYQANFEQRFRYARIDSPANPSLYMAGNRYGDPYYFYRGANGMVPSHYPTYGGNAAHLRDPRVGPQMNGARQGFTNTPYQPGVPLSPDQYLQREAPYVWDPESKTATYAGAPTGLPGVRDAGEEMQRLDHENVRAQLGAIREELGRCVYEVGIPHREVPDVERHGAANVNLFRRIWQWFIDERVTQSDLIDFERNYRFLLGSFHDSLLWHWQHRNMAVRAFWERHKYSPSVGPRIRTYLFERQPGTSDPQLSGISVQR